MAKQPDKGKKAKGEEPLPISRPLDDNTFTLICEQLTQTGSKYKACDALGFHYATVVAVIKKRQDAGDDTWAERWVDAYEKFRDSLEQEAFRRGRDGTPTKWRIDPRTNERIPIEWQFSDRLLEMSVKGHFPERYRTNVHMAGSVGLEPSDAFANLSHKAKRQIREIIMADLAEQRELQLAAAKGDVVEATATLIEDQREGDDGTATATV